MPSTQGYHIFSKPHENVRGGWGPIPLFLQGKGQAGMHPKWKGDLEARQAFNMMKNQRMSSGNQEDMDETLKYCHHVPRNQQTTGLTSLSSASPVNHPMGATCPLDCEVLVCSYHPFSGVPDEKCHDTLGWDCQEFVLSAKLSLFPWSHPLRHLMLCVSLRPHHPLQRAVLLRVAQSLLLVILQSSYLQLMSPVLLSHPEEIQLVFFEQF